MPNKDNNNQSDFMIETIKQRPINKRKLLRRTLLTAAMAVVFGTVACVTFLVLEPLISSRLKPEEPPKSIIVFPEDQQEMLPEEMLVEPSPSPTPEPESEELKLEEEQIEQILEEVVLDRENYKELYRAMSDYVAELNRYMVTVTAVTSNVDWFSNVQENRNQTSGLILEDNDMELLILADASLLRSAESLVVTFYNSYQADAVIKQTDGYTNLAVLAVKLDDLPESMGKENMVYPTLSSLYSKSMIGTPVIAMGSPMGVRNSIGYGMITSSGALYSVPDRNYTVLQTDIHGSKKAGGVLFNMDGQVVGIITNNKAGLDVENVIYAYGISEMRKTLEKLSNEVPIAYLGLSGLNVTYNVSSELGVPMGGFVTKVDMDSPAMRAGVQTGDVIVKINSGNVSSFSEYTSNLMQLVPGDAVELTVKRQTQEGYKEMIFNMETGEAKR